MIKHLQRVILTVIFLCTMTLSVAGESSTLKRENSNSVMASLMLKEDQAALELGRLVLAVRKAIQNPKAPNSINAVTKLGHDQRYYIMTRGWLSYQLQGDLSIIEASKEPQSDQVKDRISFLRTAIQAIDLE